MSNKKIDIYIEKDIEDINIPDNDKIIFWVTETISYIRDINSTFELSILITNNELFRRNFNNIYRNKNNPTNVLSFPADLIDEIDINLLGDIVMLLIRLYLNLKNKKRLLESHFAHMIVHGTLHLLGYDHVNDDDAMRWRL